MLEIQSILLIRQGLSKQLGSLLLQGKLLLLKSLLLCTLASRLYCSNLFGKSSSESASPPSKHSEAATGQAAVRSPSQEELFQDQDPNTLALISWPLIHARPDSRDLPSIVGHHVLRSYELELTDRINADWGSTVLGTCTP